MKEWTKEEQNRKLSPNDLRWLEQLHESIAKSKWRCEYHIQTVTGLMNDPNGFSFYNGMWHLFYQWFPFEAIHGMKHWYHTASKDLLHWQNLGIGMIPDTYCDKDGCFSGSAFVEKGNLHLFYTGNNFDEDGERHPYQLLATLTPDGYLTKATEPIIYQEKGYTGHQRDPKILYNEDNEKYYILLGAQNMDLKGKFLLYEADALRGPWSLKKELKVRGYDDFGYMVECPDLEKIGDKWVLLFSPQGVKADGERFQNKFNNVYFIGDMNFETCEFIPDGPYQELDLGFDFYAAQCAHQSLFKDKAFLAGWFGVSDYNYPACDEEHWAGLQTMIRELTIEDGKLKQRPVEAAKEIKGEKIFEAKDGEIISDSTFGATPNACVMEIGCQEDGDFELNLFALMHQKGFVISYQSEEKRFTIDKSELTNQTNETFGTRRTVVLEKGLEKALVFIDHSTVEIFINDGEYVMSSRIFPTEDEHLLRFTGKNFDLSIYEANRCVQDDFVIKQRVL